MTSNVKHELKFFMIYIPALIIVVVLLWLIIPLIPFGETDYHTEFHVDGSTMIRAEVDQSFEGEPDQTGYVIAKEDERILVVSPKPTQLSTGGSQYRATWGNFPPEYVNIGDEVRVWYYGMMLDSYPGQISYGKLEIIPSPKPGNADLTESEALKKALTSNTFEREVLIIEDIQYDSKEDVWSIEIKDVSKTIQVSDS